MKSATERDLSHVRADLSRVHRSMHSACLNLNANQRSMESRTSAQADKVCYSYALFVYVEVIKCVEVVLSMYLKQGVIGYT